MAIFTIQNYTYYNTEDLQALLEAAEDEIRQAKGLPLERVLISYYHPEMGRIADTVSFKDYGTTTNFVEILQPDLRSGHSHQRERLYVKQDPRWKRNPKNEVRIIPPRRLFLSPLEDLAACGDEEGNAGRFLPDTAKAQIARHLITMYQGWATNNWQHWRRVLDSAMAVAVQRMVRNTPPIRIMDKRAAVLGVEERHRVARHNALQAWQDGLLAFKRMDEFREKVSKQHSKALAGLRRSKVPLAGIPRQVGEAVQKMEQASKELEELLKSLTDIYRPDDMKNQ